MTGAGRPHTGCGAGPVGKISKCRPVPGTRLRTGRCCAPYLALTLACTFTLICVSEAAPLFWLAIMTPAAD